MRRAGFLPATRENAHAVLASGGVTIVFPGGDYDVFRPSSRATTIDFDGRKGYVRTALRAGVPIVPVVSIGGQEDQIHLSRGELIAKLFRLEERLRTKYVPVTFGFPFGLTLGLPAQPAAADEDPHRRCSTRSTSSPSSAPTPTSPRSTRWSASGCRPRSTS